MSNNLRDDEHRLSVIVTPLQPPFDEDDVVFFKFEDDQRLAVSKADGAAIKSLISQPIGRGVILSRVEGDDERIRVTVMQ